MYISSELEKAKSAFKKINPIDIKRVKAFYSGNYQDTEMLINEKIDFLFESNNEQQKYCYDFYCERRECRCQYFLEEKCHCCWKE